LRVGGVVYTNTDVYDLHRWMASHFEQHPLFERVTEAELENDPVVELVKGSSEEAKKVAKANQSSYLAVFRRIEFPLKSD